MLAAGLLALGLLAALGGLHPLQHDDLFFHLRTGEMVLEQGMVPTVDPFSYTRVGERWVSHEWGFGLLLELLRRAAGLWGLVALNVVLAAALLAMTAIASLRLLAAGDRIAALPLLAMAVAAAAPGLVLRAALLSTLLLALLIELLDDPRRAPPLPRLLGVAALVWVWANLHAGVAFGLWVIALWSLEGVSRALVAGDRRRAARWLALGASGLLALVNPNGLDTPLYPLRISRLLAELGDQASRGHYAPPSLLREPAVFALAAALVAGVLLGRGRLLAVPLARWAAVGTFLWLGLSGRRFAPELVVVVTPVAVALLAPVVMRRLGQRRGVAAAALAVVALAAWLGHRFDPRALRHPVARERAVAAAELMAREGLATRRVFHHQNFGGYLGWRLRAPVFWDGRNEVFAPLFGEIARLSLTAARQRWGFESMVLADHEWGRIGPQLGPAGWGVVYWDDVAIVAVRRDGPFAALAARQDFGRTAGFGPIPHFDRDAAVPARRSRLAAELRQVLAQAPECQRARYYLARLAVQEGDLVTARRLLEEADAIAGHSAIEAALAGLPAARPPG